MIFQNKIKRAVIGCVVAAATVCGGNAFSADSYSPFSSGAKLVQSGATTSENTSRNRIKNVLTFQEAEKSDQTGPFAGSETQMKELEKLQPIVEGLEAAIEAHNTLNGLKNYRDTQRRYNEMVQLHEKSIEVLKQSEQCVINYIGRYFNDPVSVWSGVDLRNNPQNHDLRTGLSAWALESYETAKAAQLSPIDVGDVSTLDMDALSAQSENLDQQNAALGEEMVTVEGTENTTEGMSDEDIMNYSDDDENSSLDINGKKANAKEFATQHDGIFFKEPDKQEAYEEDSRKSDLLPTDIGTEASITLADNPQKWGSVKKQFPIWNDQKTFYNQYLDGKYENINKYIQNLEINADAKEMVYNALLKDQASFMSKAEKEITAAAMEAVTKTNKLYEEEYAKLESQYNADVSAIISKAKAEIETIEKERDSKLSQINNAIATLQSERSSIAAQRESLVSSNDSLSRTLNEVKQELSVAKNMLASSTEITEEQRKEQEAIISELETEIASTEAKIQSQKQQITSLERVYDQKTQSINDKNKEKADVKTDYAAKIAKVNKKAEEEKQVVKTKFEEEDAKNRKKRDDKIAKINLAAEAAKKTLDTNSGITVKDIVNTTELIVAIAKEDAAKNIEKVRAAFYNLGDDLYRGTNQSKIIEYHQALIDNLRGEDINIDGLELKGVSGKVRGITTELETIVSGEILEDSLNEMYINLRDQYIKNTNVILNVSIFDEALKNIDTTQDNEFFVGATPKENDFRAPKAMLNFNLPPIREYVHFDYIDLKNAVGNAKKMIVGKNVLAPLLPGNPNLGNKTVFQQTEDIPLSVVDKETFLTYGGRIPGIWKLMLQDKVFVETDFFLSKAVAPEDKIIKQDALKLGGETLSLFRGGIYPCRIKEISNCRSSDIIVNGEAIVDVAYNSKGKMHVNEYMLGLKFVSGEKRATLAEQNLPECQNVTAACSRFAPSLPYLVSSKGEAKLDLTELPDDTYSELGTILALNSGKVGNEYVQNLLTLTPEMESLLVYGQRMEKASENENMPELSAIEKINDDIYKDAQYRNNQIGDFLVQAESEKTYKNAVEELKTSVEQMREDLLSVLRSMGFAPSEEFDISKDSDYDLAVSKLKSIKQNHLNTVRGKLDGLNDVGSDLLRDSKRDYTAVHKALELDKDAVTTMGMAISDSTTLDEAIKAGNANLAVDSTYQETSDKSFEEQLNGFAPAYCVAY